jgi:hypothetical protein
LVKRRAIISLIALSRRAINDFRDAWLERGKSKQQKSNISILNISCINNKREQIFN